MRTGSVCVHGMDYLCNAARFRCNRQLLSPVLSRQFLPPGFRCLLIYERPLVTQLEDDTYGTIATIHAD